MAVQHKIPIAADDLIILIITARFVSMDFQKFRRANRKPYCGGCNLVVAGVGMRMLLNLTFLFHGNRRRHQGVGGTENHQNYQHGHNLIPALGTTVFSDISFQFGN